MRDHYRHFEWFLWVIVASQYIFWSFARATALGNIGLLANIRRGTDLKYWSRNIPTTLAQRQSKTMIEHPSIPPRPENQSTAEADSAETAEDISWLDTDEDELRSPRYWVRAHQPEAEAQLERRRESELSRLAPDPDRLGEGLIEVRECLPTEPRRTSKRLRAPEHLVLDTGRQHFANVEIHLLTSRHPARFAECFLFDVNDHGIGLVTSVALPPGSVQLICAHHEDDPAPLLVIEAPVVDRREYPLNMQRPASMADQDLWIHGIQTDERNARLLMKSTLDSLTCQRAAQNRPRLDQAS